MALPEDIVTVTTATWSDHKNQPHGPVQRVRSGPAGAETGDSATFYTLGSDLEYVGQRYRLNTAGGYTGGRLVRCRFFFQRVGSPTGNIHVELRPWTSGAPDFTTLLADSQIYPVSAILTTGKNEVVFTFQIPAFFAPDTDYVLLLKISAQGDASNHIKVYKGSPLFNHYSGSRPFGSSTWTEDTGVRTSYDVELALDQFYAFALDKTGNKVRLYKTTDAGVSWAEQNSAGAPTIASTATLRSIYVQRKVDDWERIWVLLPISATNFRWHWISNDVWQTASPAPTNIPVTEIRANVSGQAPYGGGVSAGGSLGGTTKATVIYQGPTETVMGAAQRRIKIERYDGSAWSATDVDIVGSANTPDATLPGVSVHFDLRWAGMDPLGHTHIVYSKSDTSTLQYRKYKADGAFTTINTMNGAVASATAAYPVGQPTFYYQAPDWFIAVPYIDNTSNTLKVARCKVTETETAANWTITEAVAANGEITASNPAVLTTEDLQGNKLLLWRVAPTAKTLHFTHDAGANTWATETVWRSGQVVEGISAQPMEDGGGLMYLDTAPATDELRYDRL